MVRLPSLIVSCWAVVLLAAPPGALALGRAGEVDPTFNAGRPVLVDLARTVPRSTYFSGLLVDGTGRILVVGSSSDANGRTAAAVARFTGDGSLDTGFASGGSSVLQLGSGSNAYSSAQSLFAVPGRYAGFGVYRTNGTSSGGQSAFEIRADGSPDLDVGSGGLATREPATAPAYTNTESATAGPDGSLYVSGTLEQNPMSGANRKLALTKFNANGLLASGFGTNSGTYLGLFSQYPSDTGSYGGPMVPVAGNRLVLAGTTLLPTGRQGMLLARFSTLSGQLDTTFGTNGYSVTDASDSSASFPDSGSSDIAIAPDGAIYVAGSADDASRNTTAAVVRYTPAGRLDLTFGVNGVKRVQLGVGDERSSAQRILLQDDGNVVVLAGVSPNAGGSFSPRLFRLDASGKLDPSFGTNGVIAPSLGGDDSSLGAITISGGRLLVAGSVTNGSITQGAISRYLLGPIPDPAPANTTTTAAPATTPPVISPPVQTTGTLSVSVKTLKVDAKHHVAVPLGCSSAGPCAGRLQLLAASGRRALARAKRAATYASAAYSLAAGAKHSVTLTLSRRTAKLLRGRHGLRARLIVLPTGQSPKGYDVRLKRSNRPRRRA